MTLSKPQTVENPDDTIQQMLAALKSQVFDAESDWHIARATTDALTLQLSHAQALLGRADSSAASAEQTFHDGDVVTQTVLNGRAHAVAAHQRATEIRDAHRRLYEKAHAYALQTVAAAQAVDDLVQSIKANKARNHAFSTDVAKAAPPMRDQAQTALTAALAALQTSMLALAAAEAAVFSAGTVVRESNYLCQHLLPQAGPAPSARADADDLTPVTNLREYALYQVSPPSLELLVKSLPKAADHGLLYLLDAIRQVRDFTRDEMSALNSEISMELNASQHVLEKANQLHDSLRAAMNAAMAAV